MVSYYHFNGDILLKWGGGGSCKQDEYKHRLIRRQWLDINKQWEVSGFIWIMNILSGCRQVRTVHTRAHARTQTRARPHTHTHNVVSACRLAIAWFACGRPPPLEAPHSLSSEANVRRQRRFFRRQKSPFPCVHWHNAPEPVVRRCLDSVTAPVHTAAIVPDPLFLLVLSLRGDVALLNWRLHHSSVLENLNETGRWRSLFFFFFFWCLLVSLQIIRNL